MVWSTRYSQCFCVSALPCLPLMSSLNIIILKYLLVCVFLISPCCVHRDRRPDLTVSVVPSPRFVLFVFWLFLRFVPRGKRVGSLRALMPARSREFTPPFTALPSRGSREFTRVHTAVRGSAIPPFAGVHAAVRGSAIPPFAGVHAAVRGSTSPPFAGDDDTAVHG